MAPIACWVVCPDSGREEVESNEVGPPSLMGFSDHLDCSLGSAELGGIEEEIPSAETGGPDAKESVRDLAVLRHGLVELVGCCWIGWTCWASGNGNSVALCPCSPRNTLDRSWGRRGSGSWEEEIKGPSGSSPHLPKVPLKTH